MNISRLCCALGLLSIINFSATSQVDLEALPQVSQSKMVSEIGNASDKADLRLLLGKFTSLKGTFTQTIVDMQGEELQRADGMLLLQKPQKLRWSVMAPDESLLIADGSTVFNVDPFLEQVTIISQAELTQSNPLMLLISDEQSQWDQVAVLKQGNTYRLTSLQTDSSITQLILTFDSKNTLVELISYDRQQQQNSLNFSDVKLDMGVSDADFTFTVDEGWVIDDQRAMPIAK